MYSNRQAWANLDDTHENVASHHWLTLIQQFLYTTWDGKLIDHVQILEIMVRI